MFGTADTMPTSIVARRYFSVPQQVTKELKEDFRKIGGGTSSTGGKDGMAALEGYAAILEVVPTCSFNRVRS